MRAVRTKLALREQQKDAPAVESLSAEELSCFNQRHYVLNASFVVQLTLSHTKDLKCIYNGSIQLLYSSVLCRRCKLFQATFAS